MKIFYEGKDIYKDVSLNYCVYESFAEREADILVLRFNDPTGVWSKWQPKTGDVVSLEQDKANTGDMFVLSITSENGLVTIRAMSMPLSTQTKTTKSWSDITFLKICDEIAKRHNLGFESYSVADQNYKYLAQNNEYDFTFLNRLCVLEGCQMVVYNRKLIVYNELAIESQAAEGKLEILENGIFSFNDEQKLNYGSCRIDSGVISGSFNDPTGNSERVCSPDFHVYVNNSSEAIRFSKNILRNANKNALTGMFSRGLKTEYSAGSVVEISAKKAESWNGKVFLTRIRHDFIKNQTTFYFRKVFLNY